MTLGGDFDNPTVTAPSQSQIVACRWCGKMHGGFCIFVKALEFYADGVTVRRVEFHEPRQVVSTGVAIMGGPR